VREMDSKLEWPEPALGAAISELYFPRWYEGCGEKCILQPLSRATDAARHILPNKKHGQSLRNFRSLAVGRYGAPNLAGGPTEIRTHGTVAAQYGSKIPNAGGRRQRICGLCTGSRPLSADRTRSPAKVS